MSEIKTSEQLAQRALDVNVVDDGQLQTVWGELGSTTAPLGDFQQALLRRGLLTQYQLERLMNGYRTGSSTATTKCSIASVPARSLASIGHRTSRPARCTP
jgi:hypothetical protein